MTTSTTLSQDLATTLRTEILRDHYRVGDRLPSERELAARFNINRGAVREALKQLEQLGIISIQPGGARVKPKEEASLEILGHILNLDQQPDSELVDQFLVVFKALVVISAKNAIEKASEEQSRLMEKLLANVLDRLAEDESSQEAWSELLSSFLVINDNLVLRVVANGLKKQLVQRMLHVEVKAVLDNKQLRKIALKFKRGINERDLVIIENAVVSYFDHIRSATSGLLDKAADTETA